MRGFEKSQRGWWWWIQVQVQDGGALTVNGL
jgi:hypothetical protein